MYIKNIAIKLIAIRNIENNIAMYINDVIGGNMSHKNIHSFGCLMELCFL